MAQLVMMTGGGTAGHVMPNLALVAPLRAKGYRIGYIGRKKSMEERLAKEAGLDFYSVSAGRLHRDFNLENWISPWLNAKGVLQALAILRREKPAAVFCKGGFVSVPVAVAAHMTHTPVVLHESDVTPGLANRLCLPFADRICVSFPQTLAHLPEDRACYTGIPIRAELAQGSRRQGLAITGLRGEKPVVLVMGGSSGAGAINQVIGAAADRLTERYEVVHLCGRQPAELCRPRPGYVPMAYAGPELAHLYAMADVIVSRAGANTLAEILMLGKLNILIPLPKGVSRGDQILNARSFEEKGYSCVLPQEKLTAESLMQALQEVRSHASAYRAAMAREREARRGQSAAEAVTEVIEKAIHTA